MGLMSRGMNWLGERHKAVEGVTVSYTRNEATASVVAVVGDQKGNVQNRAQQGQSLLTWSDRDYLIRAVDLAAALLPYAMENPPAIGDRITETINGVAHVFEVSRKPNESPWVWSEPEQVTYRIRTKRVS